MALFVWFALLLGLNLWQTFRIVRLGEAMAHRGLWIGYVWLVPFVGAWMSQRQTGAYRHALNAAPPLREGVMDPAPTEVSAPGAAPFPLALHLHGEHGFPLLDARASEAWLASLPGAQRGAARLALHRGWLLHLRDALGEHVSLRETDTAWVLSSLDARAAGAVADYVATTRRRVSHVLGELAKFPAEMKSILVLLDDEADYYHYVAGYDPGEGEAAFSGGMFIDAACPHFVMRAGEQQELEPVIAHELTHSALAHLRLPLWLDEGLAVNTEQRLAGVRPGRHTPHELHRMHLAFWNAETVQQFWAGESFRRPDDGNLLSYDLARMIVARLAGDWPAFQRFVAAARPMDAGDSAAAAHLGVSLGRFVAALFGQAATEAWSPARRGDGLEGSPGAVGAGLRGPGRLSYGPTAGTPGD